MDLENLMSFPVQVEIPISEDEMGGSGHIKNIHYVRYFEKVRLQFLQRIGLIELKEKTGIGVLLAQTICKYLKPLAYPDQITVGAKVTSTGKSSFVLEYLIVSETLGVAASGEEVVVIYDYNQSRKTELPPSIRININKLTPYKLVDSEIVLSQGVSSK